VTFASPPPTALFDLPGVRVLRHDGATVRLQSHDGLNAVIKALSTHQVVDLRTEQPSLEDIFLAYYTGGHAPTMSVEEEASRA
jgi:ABC-2 type transport system ATP-binding protein